MFYLFSGIILLIMFMVALNIIGAILVAIFGTARFIQGPREEE